MNKNLKIYSVLLCFVFFSSCKGQIKTEEPKENINQTTPFYPYLPEPDNDPYFVESNDITSSFGPSSITRNIIQDQKGNFWFASWEGILRYEPSVSEAGGKPFTNFTNKEGLRRYHVFSVLEDKTGIIWFGTIGAGVYRYDPTARAEGKESFTNFTTKEGLANNSIGCFYEDKKGVIWIGTMGGISCYDRSLQAEGQVVFRNFTTQDGLTNGDINSIIEDKDGKMWFGTRGDACFYDGKIFTNFKNKKGQSFKNVRSVIADKKGNIWMGGNDGLWRYDGDSFTNFTKNFVGYIYEDKKGNIWTGSTGDQYHNWVLDRYNFTTSEPKVTRINKQDGQIFGIVADEKGNIWFGTERGICRYDPTVMEADGEAFNCFNK